VTSLFGILVVEREPVRFEHILGQAQVWLQDVGGFAAVGLVLWIAYAKLGLIFRPSADVAGAGVSPGLRDVGADDKNSVSRFMMLMLGLALTLHAVRGGILIINALNAPEGQQPVYYPEDMPRTEGPVPYAPPQFRDDTSSLLLTIAGLLAFLGLSEPFVRDLRKLSGRRIWALALLSFKEAVRKRVVWVFLAFLIVFLFPPKWFFPIKAEDELRTNVSVIYWAMTPLLLLTAALLASFSIPTDIRQQTIHTIVTKPVQRFEIVLGRFLGFTLLMSAVLLTLTSFSLLLIRASNVDDAARAESLQARDPLYGQLNFFARNKEADWRGDSVGREWEYRKYIAGGSSQRAIWHYNFIPSDLANREVFDYVPLEFAFDIFRTTKGEENRGVKCSITVRTWQYNQNEQETRRLYEADAKADDLLNRNVRPDDKTAWDKTNQLAEKYGFYEFRNRQVTDYHTLAIELPPGLFKKAREGDPPLIQNSNGEMVQPSRLVVIVSCDSPTQFLGMAQSDLYVLRANGSFEWNFFKGAIGLWCRLCLVIGIAVAVSTYLHGILAFLVSIFLFIGGLFQDYILGLAAGSSVGGGPLESLNRLANGDNLTMQLDPTPTVQVAQAIDVAYGWMLRRLLSIIPDVDRYSWTSYVAEGFNISGEFLIMNLLFLFAYLLPWGMLSYYLMRSREIATW